MFRAGGSEYAINGTSCRLLDIQELLSDSGIGHEMHVIVGQGQLDAILRATPEERRGFIEEAAGVLKHRKRKERALRKLDAMEANLTRLTDLTGEIRRQLGPLGRQAETARRAAVIQAEARDARLRLLADDLVQLRSTLEQEVADETALTARRAEVEVALDLATTRQNDLEAAALAARPELVSAAEHWFGLTQLVERLRATGSLAGERVRLLGEDDAAPQPATRDPEAMRGSAERIRAEAADLSAQIAELTASLDIAVTARRNAEQRYAEEQARLQRAVRAAADRREGLARLAGQVAAKQSRIEAGEAEIGRLREIAAASLARAAAAEREFARLEGSIADHEVGELGLDAEFEAADAALQAANAEVERLRNDERAAERDRSMAAARLEALELSASRRDGAAALLAATPPGLMGSVAELVHVDSGYEAAVAAALGWMAEAIAVAGVGDATAALARLRADEAGHVGLLVPGSAPTVDRSTWPKLPRGARWALDVVRCPDAVLPAVAAALDRVALVQSAAAVPAVVATGATAVTPDGDVHAPGWARGGSTGGPSVLEIQAAAEQTRALLDTATRRGEELRFRLAGAVEIAERAQARVEVALERLHESDARMSAVAEQLGGLGATVRNARAEAQRTEAAVRSVEERLATDRAEHRGLVERLDAAAVAPEETEPSTDLRDDLEAAASAARAGETEVRLTLRTREEQVRALTERADGLDRAATDELAARQRFAARQERRRRERDVAVAVRQGAAYALGVLVRWAEDAQAARDGQESARAARDVALADVRHELTVLQGQLRELTDSVHRDEVARAQQRLRIEQLETRAVEELGVEPESLVEDFGPHQPVPVLRGPDDPLRDDAPEHEPYVREAQEKRLRRAERGLTALGKVNPLALEEFTALEERHTFLTTQLEDLRASKRDLLDIVKEVDERVQRVFTDAYLDTAAAFGRVFSRLFPGGEGRLVLTDPQNMLTTGVEVEARPPGKKIKRLSLLSGGERSLTAVAMLVAIFQARPSPFYIMDEVEAALDDTNLGRLITLLAELRDSSQLIVITHQKRTMEIADALYGVTMRGDGVTTLVSQRLREAQPGEPVSADAVAVEESASAARPSPV
jgi:chromosome segregation protein